MPRFMPSWHAASCTFVFATRLCDFLIPPPLIQFIRSRIMEDAPPALQPAVSIANNSTTHSEAQSDAPTMQFRPGMNLQQQQYMQQMGQQLFASQLQQQMNNGAPLRNIAPRMSCANDVMRQHSQQVQQAQMRGQFIMSQQVLLRPGQQMPMVLNSKGPANLIPVGNQMLQLQQRSDGATFMTTSVQSAPQLMPVPGGVYTINGQQIMVHGSPVMSIPQGMTLVSSQQSQPVQIQQNSTASPQKSVATPTKEESVVEAAPSLNEEVSEAPPSLDRVLDDEDQVKENQDKTDVILESLFLREAERFRKQTENQKIIYHDIDGIVIEESSEPLPLDQFDRISSVAEADSVEDMMPPVATAKRGRRGRQQSDRRNKPTRKDAEQTETTEKEAEQEERSQSETRRRKKNKELDQLLNMDFGPKSGSRIVDEPKRRSHQQEKEEKEEGERMRTRPKRRSRGSYEGQKEEEDEPLSKIVSSTSSSSQPKELEDAESPDDKCLQCGTSLKKGRSRSRPQYCGKECRRDYHRRSSLERSESRSLDVSNCSTPTGTVQLEAEKNVRAGREGSESKTTKKVDRKVTSSPPKTIRLPTQLQPPQLPSRCGGGVKTVPIPGQSKVEPVPSSPSPVVKTESTNESPIDEQICIPKGHPDTWQISDVYTLVKSVCGQEAAEKLQSEEIDGPVLLWLSSELRLPPLSLKFGPARKIDHCLDRVRAEWGIVKKCDLDFEMPEPLNTEDDVHAWVLSVCKSAEFADTLRSEQVDGYILKTEKWEELKELLPKNLKLGPQKKLERLEQSFNRLHSLWQS